MSNGKPDNDQAAFVLSEVLLQPICFVGALLIGIGLGGGTVSFLGDIYIEPARPYQALFTFVIFPAMTLAGLLIFALGLLVERGRRRRAARLKNPRRPLLDLSRKGHRRVFAMMVCLGAIVVLGAVVASIHGYEYTESAAFCSELCHAPMGPEGIAHRDSPHANVKCAECHVGPGTDRYVKAKLSGLRQVYRLATDTYHRPIHAPISSIPGSRLVCEHCHWPRREVGFVLDNRTRYGYDLGNSKRFLRVMLRVGNGEQRQNGRQQGNIHWHTIEEGAVSFRALDDRKREIARVTARDPDGTIRVYDLHDEGERKYTDAEVEALPSFDIECLDCHNRPAHRFLTPDEAVDRALEDRAIDPSIPFIKRVAIKALATDYPNTEVALAGIRDQIGEYYTEHFDGRILERREHLESAIASVQKIYQRNIFPEMKINWETYPDNIGHRTSPGCFRCHGGKHVANDGKVLDHDCNLCHVVFQQDRELQSLQEAPADASYVHPFEDEKHYTDINCWECHGGASNPYSECSRCHERESQSEKMAFSCSICHPPGAPKAEVSSCGPCHPSMDSELHAHKDHGDCFSCHEPHNWKITNHASCESCHKPAEVAGWGDHGLDGQCQIGARFGGIRASMWGLVLEEQIRIHNGTGNHERASSDE